MDGCCAVVTHVTVFRHFQRFMDKGAVEIDRSQGESINIDARFDIRVNLSEVS